MNNREKLFYFLLFVNFYLFWLFFFFSTLSMLQFSHSFFYSILFKIFLSSHLLLLNHLSLFLSCFSYSLFLSFFCYYCLVLFNSCSHWSLPTFLFHSFEISFCCDIRSLFLFPFTYSAFSICQSCYFVYVFFFILIERFGQTCMTKE